MKIKVCIYIVIFIFGVQNITHASSIDIHEIGLTQDSLKIDDSEINSRQFSDLKRKYINSDFVYERSVEKSGWWTRFKLWLRNVFQNIFNLQSEGQVSQLTDFAVKLAGVLVFLLVIFFIFKAILNKEGKWIFGKSSQKNIISGADIENNIHNTDFGSLIKHAESDNDYRLAIRYYYLWLLKKMSNAGIIDYDVEKTNSDYQNEITSIKTKDEFNYTSYLYNYIWYGEFNVDIQEFQKAKHAFTTLFKSIKA